MYRIIPVKLLLLLLICSDCLSQTETFDIATYTPPKDFKKDSRQGVVTYTKINSTTGAFCVIAIYASNESTGDAQKDFSKEWKQRVAGPFNSQTIPKTETQTTTDGWKVVAGAAPIKLEGIDCYIILTVASGFGKTLSITTSVNDQSYSAEVDALFETMKLDKTAKASVGNNNNKTMQSNATSGKFGSMMYSPPAGWSHQQFQDGVVFKPLDLPSGEHLAIQIMQPLDFSGSLEEALAKSYDEAAAMYNSTKMRDVGGGNYEKTQPRKSFKGWEYIQGKGGVQVENGTPYKTELGLDLFVIKVNNRFERVAILKSRTNCGMSRYYSTERLKYNNAIDNFLFFLQFADLKEPALVPGSAKGEGIVGIWQGISLSVGPTSVGAPLGVGYKVFSPIFFSNGQAYFGPKFPSEGLDGLNSRIPPEINRRDWGTYTFSNGKGILKMPYGDIPLRIENNKFIITPNKTDHAFYKLSPVDGARFNGTYALSELNGKLPTITFTSDGKFTDNGALKVLYHEYVDCINPAVNPGSGTYEVKNYSVIFNYTDGRKIKIAFMGIDYDKSNSSPATLTMSSNYDTMKKL